MRCICPDVPELDVVRCFVRFGEYAGFDRFYWKVLKLLKAVDKQDSLFCERPVRGSCLLPRFITVDYESGLHFVPNHELFLKTCIASLLRPLDWAHVTLSSDRTSVHYLMMDLRVLSAISQECFLTVAILPNRISQQSVVSGIRSRSSLRSARSQPKDFIQWPKHGVSRVIFRHVAYRYLCKHNEFPTEILW